MKDVPLSLQERLLLIGKIHRRRKRLKALQRKLEKKRSRRKDHTNKRYGMLVVLEYHGKNSAGQAFWMCICDCGVKKAINASNLKSGGSTSCGCKRIHRNDRAKFIAKIERMKWEKEHPKRSERESPEPRERREPEIRKEDDEQEESTYKTMYQLRVDELEQNEVELLKRGLSIETDV